MDGRYFRGLEGKYDFDLHFILQEKDAALGDHIVRARGAWFGNRSISAEVDLEAGIYEVIPKIEASRNADAPDVGEVVMKVAERNPQKLRQIGLNYDIANAKGNVELTEEEKKKKEQKKKEVAEKKEKEKEAEEKEKADFEAWRQEEKEEYEAWKKEKLRREKKETEEKGSKDTETEPKEPQVNKANSTETDEAAKEGETSKSDDKATVPATPDSSAIQPKDLPEKDQANSEAPLTEPKSQEPTIQVETASDHDTANATPPEDEAQCPPSVAGDHIVPPGAFPGGVYGEDTGPAQADEEKRVDTTPKKWNAVCVLGLRVYSQDPDVSIKLIRPKSVEEGAILDVGGGVPAGATM